MQRHQKNKNHDVKILPHRKSDPPTSTSTTGLEPPRVETLGPSRVGAGLGSASPAWRPPGLELLRPISLLLEAAARPQVPGGLP